VSSGLAEKEASRFVGFDEVANLSFEREEGVRCKGCPNECARTITRFSTGETWITGNRCERGGVTAGSGSEVAPVKKAEDLFAKRAQMLFEDYEFSVCAPEKDEVIGIPRTLEFWDSAPFWSTFFKALGYKVVFSHPTNRKIYEKGLRYVASDTVCFPAKITHGAVQDLAEQGVDRIFMPHVMHVPPEGTDDKSPYMCAIVMGYSMVVKNFESPESRFGVKFDTPVFHWFSSKDRVKQVTKWTHEELGVSKRQANEAFCQGEAALKKFRSRLVEDGRRIIERVHKTDGFAVVLAGRPYHCDPLVSHGVSSMFAKAGIPVLTLDSLPGLSEVPLEGVRAEITNNFHTRLIEGALMAASDPQLEYAQIVSFGCGHDAILTDELTRILRESGHKSPLILKMDESDATGSLSIRVRSFIETVRMRNERGDHRVPPSKLKDPYQAKFTPADKEQKTLIIPNISREVSRLFEGLLEKEGFKPVTVPVGGIEQIRLGKKYTHNDICFPCQMVIGEAITALQSGKYDPDNTAVGMVKFQCDCRLSHYAALLRKALDAAGFSQVPVLTTDMGDSKGMHPGVALLSPRAVVEAVWVFNMLDVLNELKRKIRPYELVDGETDRVYDGAIDSIAEAVKSGLGAAKKAYRRAVAAMKDIAYDRSHLKPRVLVTGELLVTYHPGSNFDIERYLEANGMETVFPRVTDQLRKDFLASKAQVQDFHADVAPDGYLTTALFNAAQRSVERVAREHPLHEDGPGPEEIYAQVSDFMPKTLSCGEGWLMAGEIVRYAKQGVRSFVILQPFGCLPNHICGRGVTKRIKDDYPGIQILPLDLDPDTSYANVENRLQMLIMNDRAMRC
jgi:predicted nucleotide-binding protein (sugar kinase/HSP70/actin superfamily)